MVTNVQDPGHMAGTGKGHGRGKGQGHIQETGEGLGHQLGKGKIVVCERNACERLHIDVSVV